MEWGDGGGQGGSNKRQITSFFTFLTKTCCLGFNTTSKVWWLVSTLPLTFLMVLKFVCILERQNFNTMFLFLSSYVNCEFHAIELRPVPDPDLYFLGSPGSASGSEQNFLFFHYLYILGELALVR